jgi:hypothetical protein
MALIQNFRDSFARLSTREKLLVGACGAAILSFVLFFTFRTVSKKLSGLAARVETQDGQLAEILKARGKFRRAEAQFRDVEAVLKRPAPALRGFLEGIAKNIGLSIQEYRDLPSALLGRRKEVKESSIMVYPVKPDLKQLTAFMSAVENTQEHFLVVKDLRLDRAFDDHDKFQRAEVTVATYALAAPEQPAAPGAPPAGPARGR